MAPVEHASDALPLWLASIPDPVTPAAGFDAAHAALSDAGAVIDNVRALFHGTLPPSPWPVSPELQKAIDDMQVEADGFETLRDRSGDVKLSWPKTTGKYGPTLVRVGTALYTQLAALEGKAKTADSPAALLKLLPSPSALLQDVPGLLLLGVGVFALIEARKLGRFVKGAFA